MAVELSDAIAAEGGRPHVYNWKPANLINWRKALANVATGSGFAKVSCIGDSTTAGYGSAGALQAGARDGAWPTRLAALLTGRGVSASAEAAFGMPIAASMDARISSGAGWVPGPTILGGSCFNNSTTTNALAITPAGEFDRIDVWYVQNFTGVFTVDVDGGATTTVDTSGSGPQFLKTTVSCALGAHTINFKRVSGNCFVAGVWPYKSTAPNVAVWNMGWPGSKSGDWNVTTNPYSPANAIANVDPDLTVMCLGINDWNNSIPVATYTTNLQALITKAKSTGDLILVSPAQSGTATSADTQAQFVAAMEALAVLNDVPFVDFNARLGVYATANAAGYYYDTVHPSGVAYADQARWLAEMLANP